MSTKIIFERSRKGRRGYKFPKLEIPEKKAEELIDKKFLREVPAGLPDVSEVDIIRHYTNLSRRNFGVDVGFYPLGSCTMKYNPKINEDVASLPGFQQLHPLQPEEHCQGILKLLHETIRKLCEITGTQWGTLQPFAGAHGEFTGLKLFRAYFDKRGEKNRSKIIVPDSAHGTNPASAHISGFDVVEIKSNRQGMVSVENLKDHLDESVAGIMLTNPNTLGLFEQDIKEIADIIHDAGGLLYYDGANLNAIMGKSRPGDMGFDVVHLNLHKTFSTPHGGGGPGSGPVFVNEKLVPFLPVPDIGFKDGKYFFDYSKPDTIGRISGFYGNIAVIVKAYAYMLFMGADGLKRVSELAVLNANYLRVKLKDKYHLPYDQVCKHEFVLSASKLKEQYGVAAVNIAKRLLDYGVHPPTVYFPLIVPEALMIEPTETESKEVLDYFIETMEKIYLEAKENPKLALSAPTRTPVKRTDEVKAAKEPVVRWYR